MLACHPENRYAEIAAFNRWGLVVKVHRAVPRLNDPTARVIESHQTAVDHANRIAGFALPGVIAFEVFDPHVSILAATGRTTEAGQRAAIEDLLEVRGLQPSPSLCA
jgi:hypothetical protein